MMHTGLRVGKVIKMCLGDMYLSESRSAHLRINGKGQRERVVYLSSKAAQLLSEYLATRPAESEDRSS